MPPEYARSPEPQKTGLFGWYILQKMEELPQKLALLLLPGEELPVIKITQVTILETIHKKLPQLKGFNPPTFSEWLAGNVIPRTDTLHTVIPLLYDILRLDPRERQEASICLSYDILASRAGKSFAEQVKYALPLSDIRRNKTSN